MRVWSSLLLASLAVGACVDAPTTDEVDASAADGKADGAAELRVRAGDTTLWMAPTLARRGDAFVLRGRTSRNLTDGFGFVFDDPFGDWTHPSPRTFEVAYAASAPGPLFEGVNLFVSLTATNAGPLTARVVVRPRLADSAGSSKLAFTAELTPVVMAGTTVYRLAGRIAAPATAVHATAGVARLVDATHVEVDLTLAEATALAGADATLDVSADLATATVTRRAHLGLAVKKLGLTTGDAYEQWPSPTCTTAVRACLSALPDGALDTASCGDAVTTRACAGQVGVFVDGAAVDAARATVDARLADPAGFAGDAPGLVGADHAAAFTAAVADRAHGAVDALAGRWYLSATARSAQLAGAADGAFDAAYARPLRLVAAHAPAPGDAAGTRQVVADALLAYLAEQDYAHTELGRSLDQLARELRAQHVASVRALRETEDVFRDPARPSEAVYLGQWLGLYAEVTVDVATGAATRVLVELD